jgi:hypothetical protein
VSPNDSTSPPPKPPNHEYVGELPSQSTKRNHGSEPTQPTQPKGKDKQGKPYEPVEIPVPTKGDVMRVFEKVAKPPRTR